MRAVMSSAIVAVLVAAVTGCVTTSQYRESQTPVRPTDAPGVDSTVTALAGTWRGHYDSPLYARRGDLQLTLRPVAPAATVAGHSTVPTVAGTVTFTGPTAARVVVDSARVGRGRVVLYLAPMADQESAATIQLRLDGALAADTLGGRLRADVVATVAPEHRGGWRVIRVH